MSALRCWRQSIGRIQASDFAKDGYHSLDAVVAMTTHAKPMAAAAVRMLLKTSHRSSKI
jgi:hypothetical protein